MSVEEHREFGGDTTVDVSFKYLEFIEPDDEVLARVKQEYESGAMLTGRSIREWGDANRHVSMRWGSSWSVRIGGEKRVGRSEVVFKGVSTLHRCKV